MNQDFEPTPEEIGYLRAEAMDFAGIGLYRYTLDGIVQFIDRGALRIFDLEETYPDPRAAVGRPLTDLIRYVLPRGYLRDLIQRYQHIRGLEYPFRTLSGHPRWVLHDSYLVKPERGDPQVQVIIRDISDRKQAEENLRLTQFGVDHFTDAAFWVRPDAGVRYANEAAARSLGYTRDELLRLTVYDWDVRFGPGTWEPFWLEVKRSSFQRYETHYRTRAGGRLPVEVAVNFIEYQGQEHLFVLARDLSERLRLQAEERSLQEKVQQNQKLESLGVLAGGVAHDFNNLLMGVLGNASLALKELGPESPVRRRLEQIERASQRASELTNQLLAYSGKGQFNFRPVQLSPLVAEMAELLKVSISKKAVLSAQLDPSLPAVEGEPSQLRQVAMNLITNASDALNDREGVITLRTGRWQASEADLAAFYLTGPLSAGEYARLEVADTGIGMDAETLARIFEPFFTTKFTGRGLGLAAVLGIVRSHHGGIRVLSTPGQGTSVQVVLPLLPDGASDGPAEPVDPAEPPARELGRVLLVDDEADVRTIVGLMLENLGYRVVTAAGGREAVERFAAEGEAISVVLLDHTMPDLNGPETYRELVRIRPEVKVLISSGYSEQESLEGVVDRAHIAFIQKPYALADLRQRLSRLLAQ